MTVSRVLRQSPLVKATTSERVLQVAEKLGYLRGARMGRPADREQQKAKRVLLICWSSGHSQALYHAGLITALEQRLTARNCECLLLCGNGDYRGFLRMLEAAKRRAAEITFIIGDFPLPQLNAIVAAFPGAILLDNPGESSIAAFTSLAFDNTAAACLGVEHLLECGCSDIILCLGHADHFFSRELLAGYRKTLQARRLDIRQENILYTDFTSDGAAAAISALLDSGRTFDAVFSNDEMAAGICRTLLSRGIGIPSQVQICGCDNLPLGRLLYPSLTTVSLDYDALAEEAVALIHEKNSSRLPIKLRLPPELIVRESTRPAPHV
ncbi:MAG: LacI family transcriptional regulator [Oligosphaeraceae bacterium]|nr:LacI family transcriptional regulator [Oligosphaeraceae bacterium]